MNRSIFKAQTHLLFVIIFSFFSFHQFTFIIANDWQDEHSTDAAVWNEVEEGVASQKDLISERQAIDDKIKKRQRKEIIQKYKEQKRMIAQETSDSFDDARQSDVMFDNDQELAKSHNMPTNFLQEDLEKTDEQRCVEREFLEQKRREELEVARKLEERSWQMQLEREREAQKEKIKKKEQQRRQEYLRKRQEFLRNQKIQQEKQQKIKEELEKKRQLREEKLRKKRAAEALRIEQEKEAHKEALQREREVQSRKQKIAEEKLRIKELKIEQELAQKALELKKIKE